MSCMTASMRSISVTVVCLVSLILGGQALAFGSDGVAVAPGSLRAAFAGGYPSLAGKWWTWATGIYPDTPILDDTGELCDQGQSGHVWFLAGNFGGETERHCRVPRRKMLFFPILNTLWWAPEDGDTAEALREIANSLTEVDGIELGVTVDGEAVEDLFAYRAQSPPGGFAYPIKEGSAANALFEFEPGLREPAVSDGYWMLLKPLSKGEHVVTIHGLIPDAIGPGQDFILDVTYHLEVVDRL